MAYQVTKRIAGREYRYHVEGYRDPKTKRLRQKWTYLGRVEDDRVVEVRRRTRGDVRERIVAAILQLLERRDLTHVTINVIVRAARVSRATFYRHFRGRTAALNAAFASVYGEVLEVPLRADEPLLSRDVERARLKAWVETLLGAIVRRRGFYRAMLTSDATRTERRKQLRANRIVVKRSLVAYLERLRAAGLAEVADPDVLAVGILCTNAGVVRVLVYDRTEAPPERLVAGAAEVVCRAVFGA